MLKRQVVGGQLAERVGRRHRVPPRAHILVAINTVGS
jgi:hypothetical protein